MIRKASLFVAITLIIVTIAGCKSDDGNVEVFSSQATVRQHSFQEIVEMSNCVVVASFVSSKITDRGRVESAFNVIEVLRGEVSEKTIYLTEAKGYSTVLDSEYSYETGNTAYEPKKQYILIMRRSDSLFYDYPQQVLLAGIFIPVDDIGKSTMYGASLSEMTGVESADDIKSIIRTAKGPADEGQRYTTAIDFPTIIDESDYVLEVRIRGLYVEGITGNSNTYFCKILDTIKGRNINTIEESDEILVSLIKDSVVVGETYILMINSVGEDSVIYTQSSKNSVISIKDNEAVKEIEAILK
ncbi:MAG: hypothetical protein LBI19_06330 [Oscillospiraceae bacterium]|jgi:hypothetical protein|nr:hypothetical protein [Oscillospiraceae bacterium]